MPQRHRHLRRPRRPRRHRGLQRQERDGLAARVDAATPWTTSTPSPRTASPASRRPTMRWPSPARSAIPERHRFTTPSGKIEIYSMALAANPDPYGLGAIPPIPTWVAAGRAGPPLSAQAVHAEVAGAHPLDPRQPAASWPGRSATMCGCIRHDAAARGIADGRRVRVFNDRGATVLPARVTDRIAPRRRVDQGGRLVHARRRRASTRRVAPTC